jgi:uncharacterized protein YdhG (YjbR/CyaY superfamily)
VAAPKPPAPEQVDAYLAKIPPEFRTMLVRLRRTIRSAAPDAEELISYRMPAFRYRGMLMYYAAFSDHCSLFVGSRETLDAFAEEVRPFETGPGTLQFTPKHPLPVDLVKRLVRARVRENEARERAGGGAPGRSPRPPRKRLTTARVPARRPTSRARSARP